MNKLGWRYFLKLCSNVKNEESLSALLDLLLTPEEKSSLATRCLILKSLLKDQETQREMSKTLNVSISKITRGSNELKRISDQLKKYLKQELD